MHGQSLYLQRCRRAHAGASTASSSGAPYILDAICNVANVRANLQMCKAYSICVRCSSRGWEPTWSHQPARREDRTWRLGARTSPPPSSPWPPRWARTIRSRRLLACGS
jgi:hypothetical protein